MQFYETIAIRTDAKRKLETYHPVFVFYAWCSIDEYVSAVWKLFLGIPQCEFNSNLTRS